MSGRLQSIRVSGVQKSLEAASRMEIEPTECMSGPQSARGPADTQGAEDRYQGMIVTKSNKVFSIRLNRPERKNAFTTQMYLDLVSALQEAATDEDVHVAVITGTGDYYSSGNDLANFKAPRNPNETPEERTMPVCNLVKAFIDFPKPLIALVNGPAIGIAVTLLALCDAVYCSDRATFLTPFTQLGQNAEACSSYTFPKMMGGAKAAEMLLFNRKITAPEAYERNLVSRVIPDADFHKETEAFVSYVASLPPVSMQSSKKLIRGNEREVLHKVNDTELKLLAKLVQSPETLNAVLAFFSRQKSKL
ncbi:enoyl-CoA delta isomerase 2-like isoform X2 [Babylonia areolata]|uniref:enoyl-CoA delta isomerase 2-like isoform X2 n=1 Tax=Babylonia areolata TaxID=304850 RepID=UPI003FD53546